MSAVVLVKGSLCNKSLVDEQALQPYGASIAMMISAHQIVF